MADAVTRRQTLTGAAVVGVGVPFLAACGAGTSSGGSGGSGSTTSGTDLGPASEVPVGGGKIYSDERVVVTQPSSGQFNGFSAICTHQGCLVSNVDNGTINCTCHGSKFSIQDGSVVSGPATTPLSTVKVAEQGGEITTT